MFIKSCLYDALKIDIFRPKFRHSTPYAITCHVDGFHFKPHALFSSILSNFMILECTKMTIGIIIIIKLVSYLL